VRKAQIVLLATPQNIISWSFAVQRDGEAIADIDMSWFRERAGVSIGGQSYIFSRENMLLGTFALWQGERMLAHAQKTSVFLRAFEVETEGRALTLSAVSPFRREFGLFHDGVQIGRIYPRSWPGRTAVVELPDELSLPVQVFLFWLVIVLWRRRARSQANAQNT
jgi:hypothetical protein